MGFFDSLGKTISDASQSAIQKGKDMADIAKCNSMLAEEEKKLKAIYEQIGRKYVEEFGSSPADSFAEYLSALNASNEKIAEYQQKLKDLKGVTRCPACGAEIPSGSLFCPVCGAKTAEPVPSAEGVRCSGCGALVPAGSKFCTSCGKPVENQ